MTNRFRSRTNGPRTHVQDVNATAIISCMLDSSGYTTPTTPSICVQLTLHPLANTQVIDIIAR